MEKESEQTKKESLTSEEFSALSLDEQEVKLKAGVQVKVESEKEEKDQLEENSGDSEEESEEETDNEKDKSEETDQSSEEKDKKKDKESESSEAEEADDDEADNSTLRKNYKSLESEFTRRSQKLKKLEGENEALISRLDRLEKTVQGDTDKDDEVKQSIIDEMKEKNPEAAKLFQMFGNELFERMQQELQKELDPLKQDAQQSKTEGNAEKFSADIDAFLESDLKELEPEISEYITANEEAVKELVRVTPDAFKQIKERVILDNLDRVSELRSKSEKDTKSTKKKNRAKNIENASVGQGSTKSSNSSKGMTDDEFKSLSLEEMEKRLPHK